VDGSFIVDSDGRGADVLLKGPVVGDFGRRHVDRESLGSTNN
jgi:hypothetical protein